MRLVLPAALAFLLAAGPCGLSPTDWCPSPPGGPGAKRRRVAPWTPGSRPGGDDKGIRHVLWNRCTRACLLRAVRQVEPVRRRVTELGAGEPARVAQLVGLDRDLVREALRVEPEHDAGGKGPRLAAVVAHRAD